MLWAKLMIDDHNIGNIDIARLDPLEHPTDDQICQYGWAVEINGNETTSSDHSSKIVYHRYGDGALKLISLVLEKAGYGSG